MQSKAMSPDIEIPEEGKGRSNQRLEINAVYAHRISRTALAVARSPRRVCYEVGQEEKWAIG